MFAVLLVASSINAAHAQATIGGDWRADVQGFADKVIDAGLTPGMGVAITKGDWILYSGGFGVADASTGRPVDRETLFYIASSTKALTATAVALLAHKAELDLDAPVTRYLPNLRFRPQLDAASVSIENLLTMTDGIEDRLPVVFRTAYSGQFTPELLIELLSEYGPDDSGEAFDYSNLPYNILGLVIGELAPGPLQARAWKKVVEEEVLKPLGMASTTAYPSQIPRDRIGFPHTFVPGKGFSRIRLAKEDANLHAAGGHFSTAHSLARFVAAHASGGMLNGNRVFPEHVIAATHQLHVKQDRDFGPFHRFGWGYGWDLGSWEERTVIHRFGGFAGYFSHISFMPEHEIGVVILTNGPTYLSGIGANLMATYIYDRMIGTPNLEDKYETRLSEAKAKRAAYVKAWSQHLADRGSRLASLPRPLSAYAGIFEHPQMGTMVWRVIAGELEVRMGVARSRAEIYDAAKNQLRIELAGGGSAATFSFPDEGGPAESVKYEGFIFERVE